jgi:hypothetical protein
MAVWPAAVCAVSAESSSRSRSARCGGMYAAPSASASGESGRWFAVSRNPSGTGPRTWCLGEQPVPAVRRVAARVGQPPGVALAPHHPADGLPGVAARVVAHDQVQRDHHRRRARLRHHLRRRARGGERAQHRRQHVRQLQRGPPQRQHRRRVERADHRPDAGAHRLVALDLAVDLDVERHVLEREHLAAQHVAVAPALQHHDVRRVGHHVGDAPRHVRRVPHREPREPGQGGPGRVERRPGHVRRVPQRRDRLREVGVVGHDGESVRRAPGPEDPVVRRRRGGRAPERVRPRAERVRQRSGGGGSRAARPSRRPGQETPGRRPTTDRRPPAAGPAAPTPPARGASSRPASTTSRTRSRGSPRAPRARSRPRAAGARSAARAGRRPPR